MFLENQTKCLILVCKIFGRTIRVLCFILYIYIIYCLWKNCWVNTKQFLSLQLGEEAEGEGLLEIEVNEHLSFKLILPQVNTSSTHDYWKASRYHTGGLCQQNYRLNTNYNNKIEFLSVEWLVWKVCVWFEKFKWINKCINWTSTL